MANSISISIHNIPHTIPLHVDKEESIFQQIKSWLGSACGAYQFTALIGKVGALAANVAERVNSVATETFKQVSSVFGKAAGGMTFATSAYAICDTGDQFAKVLEKGAGEGRGLEAGRRVLDLTESMSYSVMALAPDIESLGPVASVAGLGVQSISAFQAYENIAKVDVLLPTVQSEEVKGALYEEKTFQLLSIVKAVAAVATGVIALVGTMVGAALLPPIVSLSIGVALSILGVVKHFYKENMTYEPMSKWKPAEEKADGQDPLAGSVAEQVVDLVNIAVNVVVSP